MHMHTRLEGVCGGMLPMRTAENWMQCSASHTAITAAFVPKWPQKQSQSIDNILSQHF